MARTPVDPTDHSRTTQPHSGEFMKDTRGLPGYLLMGVAVLSVVACVAAAGYGHQGWTILLGLFGVLTMIAGAEWVYVEHRRLRRIEAQQAAQRHRRRAANH
jgi:uncharacterized membrane protein YcjF (UPF0283 family)